MVETVISNIETLKVHVPVTAVYFANDASEGKQFLLSGSGGFVSVFDLNDTSYELVAVVNVLGSRNIHGFGVKTGELQICAFGERFMNIFKLKEDILTQKCVSKEPFCFHDRVLDVRWLRGHEANLAVLLAHNEFQLFDPCSWQVVKSVRCEQNSVLFSGLIVDSPDMPFVVAGACLGYLYIWQPLQPTGAELVQAQLNLSNAGGVFCLAVKNDWRSLAIACEDRGVYVFNLDIPSKKIVTLQTLFGHGARIWKVCWAENYLVTAGEDCQVLLWNLENGSVLHRFESKSNTNFFALAVDPLHSSKIAAGLSDGSVRIYNAKPLKTEATAERPGDDPAVTISDRAEHVVCLRFIDLETIFYVSNCGKLALIHLENNSIEALETNQHYSMAVCLATKRIDKSRSFVSLAHGVPSVISVFELVFEPGKSTLSRLAEFPCPGKMPRAYLLSWLFEDETCGRVPKMFASNFDVAQNCVFNIHGTKLIEFDLSKSVIPPSTTGTLKHFDKIAITCGASFESPINKGDELFVFGDNCGSVFVAKPAEIETTEAVFLQVFPHIHGRDGCHSISYLANDNTLVSCGGASSVSFFRIEKTGTCNNTPLTLLNTIKPCSSLDFTVLHFTSGIREFVCGFAQKSFMLSSVQPSQSTLAKHYCSGRKREWDVIFHQGENISVKFAYIRAGQAYMVPMVMSPGEESREVGLQPPLHGLRIHECKFICHLPVSDSFVFVLASEDDTASIVAFEQGTSLHVLQRLAGHISGVRCVQVVKQSANELKFLLFTGGSRGIIIAWTLSLTDANIADLKKSTFCRKIAQVSLTNQPISSFELPGSSHSGGKLLKGAWRHNKIFGPPLTPDMRFMDVATIAPSDDANADTFRIYAITACSDATVRLFELNIGTNVTTFDRVLCLSEGLSFCQLRVTFASTALDNSSNTGVIVSGDTGGYLNVWHWPNLLSQDDEIKPVSVRIHQSGVNAVRIIKAIEVFGRQNDHESSSLIAFTGGDDAALVVSKLYFENPRQLQSTPLLRINSAHSSQISGLSFINSLSLICTVSIDQRVRFWKFPTKFPSNGDSQRCFLNGYVSCVADCSSLAIATENSDEIITSLCCATPASHSPLSSLFVLVVGEGCQFIKVHLKP